MVKQKKYHYIYKTTCLITGKFYVGMHSTDNLDDGYLGSGKILGYSRRKYGDENHTIERLEFLQSREELKRREKEIVNEELLSQPLNINLKYGGDGGWDHLNQNSEIQRAKSLKGNAKQKQMRLANPEWFAEKTRKMAETQRQRYASGERAGVGWSIVAVKNAQSQKSREQRKTTMQNNQHQKGKNNSQFGVKRVGINKDGKIKKVLPHQVQDYLDAGWNRGFR